MSQVAVHHPSSYAHSGQMGLPASVTAGVSATFSYQGLDPSTPMTVVWGDATGNGSFTTNTSGAGTAAHTYASNGTYTQKVTNTATGQVVAVRTFTIPYAGGGGFAPAMILTEGNGGPPPEESFDPGAHTVAEVMEYATANPDQADELLAAEQAGKDRSSLVSQLEAMLPYDPGAHTVAEVVDYATANPDQLADIIEAEQSGKNRSTLLSQLDAMV